MNPRRTTLALLLSVVVLAGLEISSIRLASPNPTPALAAERPTETASTEDASASAIAISWRLSQAGVYAGTIGEAVEARLADLTPRVYVPNSDAGTVDVIDPKTFRVVDHLVVGGIPHHVAPARDLSRLYVDVERSNVLVIIDPRTGKPAGTIPVTDPYNLYFTPDGSKAIVVAERFSRLDFRNPQTWELIKSVPIPWPGIDHLDFSADGSYLMASTEWSGMVAKVDTVAMQLLGGVKVGGLPIDVRLSPDGSVFYVANQGRHGVSIVDPVAMKEVDFLPTGRGAHGLQVSRDAHSLYVSNRLAGSISVIDFGARQVTATWKIGGSPDMFQLSPDGHQLWVSGRYHSEVYVVDTTTGVLLHKIRTGAGTHGLCYFPNVGRFSVGHNGVYR
jgi:YVTN family beta-propeller protein